MATAPSVEDGPMLKRRWSTRRRSPGCSIHSRGRGAATVLRPRRAMVWSRTAASSGGEAGARSDVRPPASGSCARGCGYELAMASPRSADIRMPMASAEPAGSAAAGARSTTPPRTRAPEAVVIDEWAGAGRHRPETRVVDRVKAGGRGHRGVELAAEGWPARTRRGQRRSDDGQVRLQGTAGRRGGISFGGGAIRGAGGAGRMPPYTNAASRSITATSAVHQDMATTSSRPSGASRRHGDSPPSAGAEGAEGDRRPRALAARAPERLVRVDGRSGAAGVVAADGSRHQPGGSSKSVGSRRLGQPATGRPPRSLQPQERPHGQARSVRQE